MVDLGLEVCGFCGSVGVLYLIAMAQNDPATTTGSQTLSRQADADRLGELSVSRCGGANARISIRRSRVYELWQRFWRPTQHHPRRDRRQSTS